MSETDGTWHAMSQQDDSAQSTKRCKRCGEVKPHSAFSKRIQNEDGLAKRCRTCVIQYTKPKRTSYVSDDPTQKRCSKCREIKSLTAFSKDKSAKDGVKRRCKACEHNYYVSNAEAIGERIRKYREANLETIRERKKRYYDAHAETLCAKKREYRAANAEVLKEKKQAYYVAHRNAHRESRRAYYAANSEAIRARVRAYRIANPEIIRERKRAWEKANPDTGRIKCHRRRVRLKGNGGDFTRKELIAMRMAQNGVCAYCRHEHEPRALTLDHVIPIAQGGRHEAANIVLACPVCNYEKGNRTPEQWANRWYYDD